MKRYIEPELTEINFDERDIITTSEVSVDIDGGSTKFPDAWKENTGW